MRRSPCGACRAIAWAIIIAAQERGHCGEGRSALAGRLVA